MNYMCFVERMSATFLKLRLIMPLELILGIDRYIYIATRKEIERIGWCGHCHLWTTWKPVDETDYCLNWPHDSFLRRIHNTGIFWKLLDIKTCNIPVDDHVVMITCVKRKTATGVLDRCPANKATVETAWGVHRSTPNSTTGISQEKTVTYLEETWDQINTRSKKRPLRRSVSPSLVRRSSTEMLRFWMTILKRRPVVRNVSHR